jgi:hypothetical protein
MRYLRPFKLANEYEIHAAGRTRIEIEFSIGPRKIGLRLNSSKTAKK